MNLQTPVNCGRSSIGLSYEDKILVLGSCFADNIGQKLVNAGFDVLVNPFGTLYNPSSLGSAIERLRSGDYFTESDCVMMGSGVEKYCSFNHHTSFARDTAEDFLSNANQALDKAQDFYQNCNKIILTFGTSFCYIKDGVVVSNCLKLPSKEFFRYMLDANESEEIISNIIQDSGKKFFLTVSPIRHLSNGAAANQLSKSNLIVAVSGVCQKFLDVEYFPAYEIVMDELRDYRFYAEDMVHPTPQTINYLWERFVDFALDPQQKEKLLEAEKLYRQSQHRRMF